MDASVSVRLEQRLRRETLGQVLFDAPSRGRYATDASIYQIQPVGVLIPRRVEDIATAIEIARDLQVPVLPRGAGTSQCGQTVGACLVIDYSKYLRAVLRVDPADRTATVEPGIVLDQLNAELRQHGLWFPVDVSTSAQATLGGMAGNNSCGSRSIAYGNMVHNVLGVSAWLSDGSLVEFGPVDSSGPRATQLADFVRQLARTHRAAIEANWPKVLRRVGGYNLDIFHPQSERPYTQDGSVNLAHLLIGSEGTLACTRSLELQLAPLPRNRTLGVVNFPTFRGAMEAAQHIVRLQPTAVELVDQTMIELALANPVFRPIMSAALIGSPAAILLVEFSDATAGKLEELSALMGDLGLPGSVIRIPEAQAQKDLWEVRKAGLNIMMSAKGDGKPVSFIEDCAVPLVHLAEYTDALTEVFAKYGTRGTWYAHASVGTLHVRPILDMRRDGAAKMRAIAEEASALVRRFRGAYSGEHGDGLCRGEWIEWQFGPQIYSAFRAIKQHLDPIGLFNPGKIIDPPRMDDATLFRFPPNRYQVQPLAAELDWSDWGGFAKAIEMCNNNGHCRKFDAGVMCPSYRATRDEEHSTRGRANTLRLAVSGQLGIANRAVLDSMDLCVGCKACKRECPTGIDMARLKVEALAQYKGRNGYTLRDRLIAGLPDYAARASQWSWLLNLRDQWPGAAWLSEKMVGFAARRPLPRWRTDTFWKSPVVPADMQENSVLLFVDTFNGTFETENVLAARRVLGAAGYKVHTLAKGCCGRTYLSTGMVERAKAKAAELIAALLPFAKAGVAIVGLEPSCLLTLRDEALVMGLGDDVKIVAAQALLFEEFIAREIAAGRFQIELELLTQPVLVHGHCHQKAFGAIAPVMEVLRLIPGVQPKLIESSCCGMAGAFGYESEHYDVSMQMAELSLLPAVRNAPEGIVVADGTSCRHQIFDGAQRTALHVARLLEQQLVS